MLGAVSTIAHATAAKSLPIPMGTISSIPCAMKVRTSSQFCHSALDTVQEQVRQSFFDGVHLEIDRRFAAPLANLVGSFSIARARDAAWTNARVLWELDGVEPVRGDFVATLSRTVGLVGRGLLTPVALPDTA